MTGLCPVVAYAGCFGWAFLEWEYSCQQNIAPMQALFYPGDRRHVSYQLYKERKILSCNPNVFIRTSLTFGIPTLNAARTSSPAPLPVTGQFLLFNSPRSVLCPGCFVPRWGNWSPLGGWWELQRSVWAASDKQTGLRVQRAKRALFSWNMVGGELLCLFSCGKERNCLGNSSERQKRILLNQISLDLSRLL